VSLAEGFDLTLRGAYKQDQQGVPRQRLWEADHVTNIIGYYFRLCAAFHLAQRFF
jgi:hypothetical protein